MARVLFWFTGHPIVYFWLLPAYISWYVFVPKQAGGRLYSDPLARVAFIMFLALSTPLGFHHQFTDPGISEIEGYSAPLDHSANGIAPFNIERPASS